MTDTPKRYQCRHIFTGGHRCGSPCLRQEELCYYHHTTRRPVENPSQRRRRRSRFDLPLPDDRGSIQLSIGEVLHRIARNEIDPKRAGLLLYGLQIASLNLPRNTEPARDAYPVEEIVSDPQLGTLAPRIEVGKAQIPEERLSVVDKLLRDWKQKEAKENEEIETSQPPAPPPALADTGQTPKDHPETSEILPTLHATEEEVKEVTVEKVIVLKGRRFRACLERSRMGAASPLYCDVALLGAEKLSVAAFGISAGLQPCDKAPQIQGALAPGLLAPGSLSDFFSTLFSH
jgi:hypothetical protein